MVWEYLCKRCNKVKPWYSFSVPVNEEDNPGDCLKCKDRARSTLKILERILIEKKIKRLMSIAVKNKMPDLRNHLFETLEEFRKDSITLQKAKGVCDIAQTIINSAKVEVEYIKAIGSKMGTGFIQIGEENK